MGSEVEIKAGDVVKHRDWHLAVWTVVEIEEETTIFSEIGSHLRARLELLGCVKLPTGWVRNPRFNLHCLELVENEMEVIALASLPTNTVSTSI